MSVRFRAHMPANENSDTAVPTRPVTITGRRPRRSAKDPQRDDVRKNNTADEAKIVPTWTSPRPMPRAKRPTVEKIVAFAMVMAKTEKRTVGDDMVRRSSRQSAK